MIRSRSPLALAVALGAGALACTKGASTPAGVRLRQPTSIAVFQGRTLQNPTPGGQVRPYIAVASTARNDLSIVDATNDTAVPSPIQLQTLVIPVPDRPTLVAAASLGDDDGTLASRKPDLLVAVSGGSSVLQVVETWKPANLVHTLPPAPGDTSGLAQDLGNDILALAPVPSAREHARIAAVLADSRVAIVEYRRKSGDADGAIEWVSTSIRATPLPFRPLAVAALDNGVRTALYLATLDEIEPGIFGVAELPADDVNAAPGAGLRALGARGPTRLVAALRLRERNDDPADPARRFVANDGSAFERVVGGVVEPMPVVPRVYAVLDESGCGPTKRIDCGVVALDPSIAASPASIPQAIPPDWAGLMPYRAPMRTPGRPLALAVSGPPALAPEGDPIAYPGLMRIYMGGIPRATTGVAAVPGDGGGVYFLDLGRFETETLSPALNVKSTGAPNAAEVSPDPSNTLLPKDRRLWLQTPPLEKRNMNGDLIATIPDGAFLNNADFFELYASIATTPGFTTDETWTITYQGFLSNDLFNRVGEVGTDPVTSQPWLALQLGNRLGGGSPTFTQVVKLWHPDLAVQPNDILVFKAAGVPAPPGGSGKAPCVGKLPKVAPGGTTPDPEFELRVGALLPPSAQYPGGAVTLVPPDGSVPEWLTCYEALQADAAGTTVVSSLLVSVRAHDLVMLGRGLGYAGRPELGDPTPDAKGVRTRRPFALAYPTATDEDQLAAACPLADWDGHYPADPAVLTCGGTCDRTVCEQLVLARKARRFHHLSVDCSTDATLKSLCDSQTADTLPARWPAAQYPFPFVNGPAIAFSVVVQYRGSRPSPPDTDRPVRDMSLTLTPESGVFPIAARQNGTSPYQASDAVAFDRTPWVDATAGYRFLVSYPADFVLDATPSQYGSPVPAVVIK